MSDGTSSVEKHHKMNAVFHADYINIRKIFAERFARFSLH